MRALVLGGAGEVGRHLTWRLAQAPEVEHIRVAELDYDRAQEVVAEASGCTPGDAVQVDLDDGVTLAKLLKDRTCLINCTPFPLFDRVIRAAAAAGVDYVDFISEPSEEHQRLVGTAGIFAISGVGLSPGT